MKTKRILHLLPILALALGISACGGGSGVNGNPGGGTTDFATFVKQQLAQTSDTTDPVDVTSLTFVNQDDEDPTNYDDVLGP